MPITTDDIRPFFQVLIFKAPNGLDLARLIRAVVRHINSKNEGNASRFEKIEALVNEAETHAAYYKHTQNPPWYRIDKAAAPLEEHLRNREFDLIILHLAGGYLFLHCSCRALSDRVKDAVLSHKVGKDWVSRVSSSQIRRVFNNSQLRLSTIAIDNVFGVGGTAPEAKAYYSPDAAACLSSALDSGYALNYFFGKEQVANAKPVGGSSAKRKIWKSWVEDIDAFKGECAALATLLDTDPPTERLQVLVNEIPPFAIAPGDIIAFNLSCVSDHKQIRLRHDGHTYSDWAADLHPDHNDRIRFTLNTPGAHEIRIDYEFAFDSATNTFAFGPNGDDTISVKFAADSGDELAQEIELADYLSSGSGYTFLFTEGRAFYEGIFSRNNRFKIPFQGADTALIADWSDVELKRESDSTGLPPGKMTILAKATLAFNAMTPKPKYTIVDDGANEIADHVVLFENKVILSHAKYSKSSTKGLRVDDLQVVSSQALKAMRFFSFESYTDDALERLRINSGTAQNFDDFKDSVASIFHSLNLEKECWIVQPGISRARLDAQPANKIHTLMNYVEGICRNNGVRFRLICNS